MKTLFHKSHFGICASADNEVGPRGVGWLIPWIPFPLKNIMVYDMSTNLAEMMQTLSSLWILNVIILGSQFGKMAITS